MNEWTNEKNRNVRKNQDKKQNWELNKKTQVIEIRKGRRNKKKNKRKREHA